MEQAWVEIGRVTRAAAFTGELDNRVPASSIITIHSSYEEGLEGLEPGMYLDILFLFRPTTEVKLKDRRLDGQMRGIFATRSPHRPSRIGLTRVMLVGCCGRDLEVSGLDAWEGSPVIDIKPSDRIRDNN